MTSKPDATDAADGQNGRRRGAETAGRVVGAALATGRELAGRTRETIRKSPRADRVYRTAVGVTGGTTVALGVVLMPLPGPGTLIALGGIAILGSEFDGAKKVGDKANAAVKAAAAKAKEAKARSAAKRASEV